MSELWFNTTAEAIYMASSLADANIPYISVHMRYGCTVTVSFKL